MISRIVIVTRQMENPTNAIDTLRTAFSEWSQDIRNHRRRVRSYKHFGSGFLESVYQEALAIEL